MQDTATDTLDLLDTAQPVRHSAPALAPAQLPAALPANSPAAMMLAAADRNMDPETLMRLLDVQERFERREAEKAFRQDFAAFRGENIIIPKTKHVDRGRGGSFDQAEYDEVCRRLSPALSRHGFSFRHDQKFGLRRMMVEGVESDVGWVWVTCHLEHRQGHVEKLELEGPPGELSVNTPTQNMQTTASYLKRQSLLAITGTATGGEDNESRMRDRQPATEDDDESEALLTAGQEAAMEGMQKLTAWWASLDSKQRSAMNKDFGALRKAAAAADREAAHG